MLDIPLYVPFQSATNKEKPNKNLNNLRIFLILCFQRNNNMRDEIIRLLLNNRMKEALSGLSTYAAHTSDWQLKEEIEALQTSYGLMLEYTAKGMEDPDKKALYNRIRQAACEIAERIRVEIEVDNGRNLYYEVMRTHRFMPPHSFAELQLQLEAYTEDMETAPLIYPEETKRERAIKDIRERHETATDELFEKTWVSVHWSRAELAEARALFRSPLIQANDLCVWVSAVTLALLYVFDVRKFIFLLDAYTHPANPVSQRVAVGIALCGYCYGERMVCYPKVMQRIRRLNEEPRFIRNLYDIQIQLLQSARETRKIDKRMREEILPEMMKNPMLRRPRLGIEETEESEDFNPEWQKWIDQSKIGDKLSELGELQLAGADVYMSTFSQLKNFPFFKKISHWFYPFDPQYPTLSALSVSDKSSMLHLLLQSDTFCNSDKYSFCFTLMQMPEPQRKYMESQINGQQEVSEELKEHIREMVDGGHSPAADVISRQYIQDLYRFFKLWPRRNELHDLFNDPLDLWNQNLFAPALHDRDVLIKLADYLFTHSYLAEAGSLYSHFLEQYDNDNAEIWQKWGYVCQKSGDYEQAIECYRQADLFAPDKVWNNRHLAQCYKKKGDYETAVTYYKKVEQIQPDNLTVAFQLGQCLIELERYEEALAYFFKIEYMETNTRNARRAIGWCLFLTGKHREARKYYDELVSEPNPSMEDWMNAGHVYYLLGETSRALASYRKAHELCGNHDRFMEAFTGDQAELLRQGISETDFYLLPDELI